MAYPGEKKMVFCQQIECGIGLLLIYFPIHQNETSNLIELLGIVTFSTTEIHG